MTVCVGARTSALTSMVIRPTRGLGGQALLRKQMLAVPHYDQAPGITHDYDGPVLGEGVVGLAVVPLMSGPGVRGLLYAATRERAALTLAMMSSLAAEAHAVSVEMSVRDEVERRLRSAEPVLTSAAERLRSIARTTRDPVTRTALLDLLSGSDPRPPGLDALTPRQRDVLELAELGLRNAEIGARLGLSEQTVKTYMRALMARLGARSRQEAVYRYRSQSSSGRAAAMPERI
ncbi:response regulator transcription factor [Cryptosporangium aurantiacum]|uniref:response regulator transcription factor n=1 Tax=Cryptosporangium aurantiacum TaxID=134849 RepID=UPI00116150A3|nr:LuxR C-terminal-related transcriptional regulator [Cryptosporangium aurantiacum]